MKSILQTVALVAAIVVAAAISEQIPPLVRLTLYLEQHPEPYRRLAIGAAVIGWLLLMTMVGLMLWSEKGRAARHGVRNAATFREIKAAFRSGDWWNDPAWSPIFIGLLAVFFLTTGLFGFFFVIGPPLVKVLCGGALFYAAVQIAWGFRQA